MNRIPIWLKRCAATVASLLMFCYLTIIFIPSTELQRLAERIVAPYGLTLTATSFGKAFPLGIHAKGVTLSNPAGNILTFDRISLQLNLAPLLAGRIIITCDAGIGAGTVVGELEITRKGRFDLSCSKVRLEAIPFFRTVAGAQAKGELRGKSELKGTGKSSGGYLQIEARDLDLRSIAISGTSLPDASYRTMQGMVRIAAGKAVIESATLQGDALYVRLSGNLPAGSSPSATPLNLKLELMPKPDFLESQKFVFLLLTKYMVTPGQYQLPIRGTLALPVLQ